MASICDYTFWSVSNGVRFEVTFHWDGTYELGGSGPTNSGPFTIDNGYIELYSPSNDYTTYIPWEWDDNGNIDVHVFEGLAGM